MKWCFSLIVFFAFVLTACNSEEKPAAAPIADTVVSKPATLTKIQQEKAYRLDALFSQLFLRNEFNGNVLIAENGTILHKKSYGIANTQTKQLLSDSTLFQLASVSKSITACLILQLTSQGKINLQHDVRKYLPDFPYEGIQVSQLLSHRSGLFNYIYFCAEKNCDPTKKLSNAAVYEMILRDVPKPYLKPGQQFNYCNTNYMLLALIAEKAGKKSFKELLRENIFTACNMQSTYFADEITENKLVAKGYTFSMREVEGDMFDYVWGDKGIYTTTNDLFLFEEAYFSGKLIPKAYLDSALTPYSSERKLGNYGYGWRMKNFNDAEKIVYHNGWWHGYRSAMQRRLKDNVTIIVLSNRLNRSVYHTWKMFNAIDGIKVLTAVAEEKEE